MKANKEGSVFDSARLASRRPVNVQLKIPLITGTINFVLYRSLRLRELLNQEEGYKEEWNMEHGAQNSTNNSQSNITMLNSASARMTLTELSAITAFYLLLALAILIGNGLILSSFAVNKRLRTSTNTLVMGLAVSDLLVGLVSIPSWIYICFCFIHDKVDHIGYQFYITSDIFIGSASILQLTSISIERCHAVVRPFQHRTLSVHFIYILLLVPWFYAGFMASLHPVQNENWEKVYTILMAVTCFLLPVTIIIIAYGCIYRFARSKPRRKLTRHRAQKKYYNKELRLSITFAVITGLFVIAWMPLFGVTFLATYFPTLVPSTLATDRLLKFVKFCHYSNSALNPFLYAFRNSEMTRTFRYLVYRLLCRMQEPISHSSKLALKSATAKKWQRTLQANKRRKENGSRTVVMWYSSV